MRFIGIAAQAILMLVPALFSQETKSAAATSAGIAARGSLDATQYSGIDGCAKINSAIAALPAEGGIVDATGFTSPQVVSTTCISSASPTGSQTVEIDFNPATQWEPSIPSMSVLSMNPKSIVRGMHINASTRGGYTGTAVEFVQQNDADTDYTLLEDTQIDLPKGSGIGIYISPLATGFGYSGLNIRGLRIFGGSIAISMVSGPGMNQYLNSNNVIDFWIKDSQTCISMDGSAQITAQTWLSAMAGNHFSDGACQIGPSSQYTIVLKNSSDNNFSNVTTWDGGVSIGDATSNYNYWVGFGSLGIENWLGQGNNYQDAHGDSISPTGMHEFRYAGGVNFIGPKAQFTWGQNAVQWLPSNYNGYPAFEVAGGGAADTFIGSNKINTNEYDQGGSPVQGGGGLSSGTGSIVPTQNGFQVTEGGYSNILLEGNSIDFVNGTTTWKLQENPNGINVVRVGCCSQTMLDGNKMATAEYDLSDGRTSKMLLTTAPPVIASGFGKSASIVHANGPSSFTINVGSGGTATNGVLALETAMDGWICTCNDLTTTSSTVFMCKQIGPANASLKLGNFNNQGQPAPWASGDTLGVSCFAN